MPFALESPRRRWILLGAAWMITAILIALHTRIVADYVDLLDEAGQREGGDRSTPLRQIIPAHYGDAQMWIRHVINGHETGQARIRFTTVDNAPLGREVHWSSGLPWLIRSAAAAQRAFSGKTGPAAIEGVLPWFNAPLLLSAIVLFSIWTARRLGAAAGVLTACAMFGHPRFYQGFMPMNVDHHGLVNAAILGLILGVGFMGFGWWRDPGSAEPTLLPADRRAARRAAVISALGGAVALWVSAAAALPAIALVGIAGFAASHWFRPAETNVHFEPGLWRLWGRTGAVAAFLLYLVEYAPAHLGWRLEVNHPLHALAWWGGAEFIAIFGGRRRGTPLPPPGRLALPLVALTAAPVAILLGSGSTFLLGDPFIGELRHFVGESRSLPATIREFGINWVLLDLLSILVLVPAAILLWGRRSVDRPVLGALTTVAVALMVMACVVMRWWQVASTAQIALLIGMVAAVDATPKRRELLALAAAVLVFLLPAAWRIAREHLANRHSQVAEIDLYQPLYRDLAGVLRATNADGDITLLSSPNASAGISYFGRFKSIGTLFWENAAGLRAAASILCAENDDEALRLIRARGVTHLVLFSNAPFVGEYFRLLYPTRPAADARRTFGFRLMSDLASAPRWLQPIPYRPPAALAATGKVSVFKVVADLPEDQRLFHIAVAQIASGDPAAAEESFLAAMATVPPAARASFLGFAGEAAYEQGAQTLAAGLFRRSLALANDPGVANILAWILATSPDPKVRDGTEALALIGPIAQRGRDDPMILSTLAATYAELGRFDTAIAEADRALALIRKAGADPDAQALLAERLATYRSRRPWRQ